MLGGKAHEVLHPVSRFLREAGRKCGVGRQLEGVGKGIVLKHDATNMKSETSSSLRR